MLAELAPETKRWSQRLTERGLQNDPVGSGEALVFAAPGGTGCVVETVPSPGRVISRQTVMKLAQIDPHRGSDHAGQHAGFVKLECLRK